MDKIDTISHHMLFLHLPQCFPEYSNCKMLLNIEWMNYQKITTTPSQAIFREMSERRTFSKRINKELYSSLSQCSLPYWVFKCFLQWVLLSPQAQLLGITNKIKWRFAFIFYYFHLKITKHQGSFLSVLLVRCFYSLLLLVPRIKMWSFYKWLCQFYLEIRSFKLTPSQATPNVIELHPHMYTFRGIFLHKKENATADNCFLKHKMISLATHVTYVMATI